MLHHNLGYFLIKIVFVAKQVKVPVQLANILTQILIQDNWFADRSFSNKGSWRPKKRFVFFCFVLCFELTVMFSSEPEAVFQKSREEVCAHLTLSEESTLLIFSLMRKRPTCMEQKLPARIYKDLASQGLKSKSLLLVK